MLEMNQMLKIIVERDASDLHCSVGKPTVMRIYGKLDIVDSDILTPDDTERLMREITPPRYQQESAEFLNRTSARRTTCHPFWSGGDKECRDRSNGTGYRRA